MKTGTQPEINKKGANYPEYPDSQLHLALPAHHLGRGSIFGFHFLPLDVNNFHPIFGGYQLHAVTLCKDSFDDLDSLRGHI